MKDNLKKQFIWNTLGSGFYAFNSLFFMIIATRINGVSNAGVFSLCFATATIFYTVAVYSGRTYQVSENQSDIGDNEFIFNRFFLSAVMLVLAFSFGIINGYTGKKMILLSVLCTVKFIEAISDVLHGVLQKNHRLDIVGKSLLIKSALYLFVFLIVDLFTKNIVLSSVSMIFLSAFVLVLYDYPAVLLYKDKSVKLNIKASFKILTMGFYTFAFTFIANYLVNIPRYAIDEVLSDEFLTIFGIIVMPASIITLVGQFALQPMVSRLNNYQKNGEKRQFLKIISILSIVSVVTGLVAVITAYLIGIPVLNLLYGINLKEYLFDLVIIIIGATVYSLACVFSNALTVLRKTRIEFVIYVFDTVIAIFLAKYLTGLFGFVGAVYSYLLTMAVLLLSLFLYFEFAVHKQINWSDSKDV